MKEGREKADQSARKRKGDSDENSKGQYGGLKGLGPGGGRNIEEAAETEDINPATTEHSHK